MSVIPHSSPAATCLAAFFSRKILSIEPVEEYYAIGIRNGYGLALDPITGFVWDTENGPAFYDEINLVEKGFNSGSDKISGHSKNEFEKISAFSENIFLPERWYNLFVQILKGNDVFSNFGSIAHSFKAKIYRK